eukprot:2052309-Lingulodinium_polyedra.AAC.1
MLFTQRMPRALYEEIIVKQPLRNAFFATQSSCVRSTLEASSADSTECKRDSKGCGARRTRQTTI